MKPLANIILENSLISLSGLKVQQQILDKPRKVTEYHYCLSEPKKRENPQLIGLSRKTLQLLGIDYEQTKQKEDTPFFLSGSKLLSNSTPVAHNYSGHQFGVFAGQLGDGRAHTIGNIFQGGNSYQLQLKGSGLTPFSRHADGNSVVSSAVREFLASELMAGLNVPTTRAASLVIADQLVRRDPFYNGKIKIERAAIVLRVCESFLRFGSLQVCLEGAQLHQQNPLDNRRLLQPLCDYIIKLGYKDIDYDQSDPYEELYQQIVKRSAQLVAQWQSIGFCHGVLNTDNMSLLCKTIDYGPYGFIDYFSKDFVSSATDDYERYSYRRQPNVIKFNLGKLAEAMDPLVPQRIIKKYLQKNFQHFYKKRYYELMAKKLGVVQNQAGQKIIDEAIEVMHACGTNFTNFFRIIEENFNQQEFDLVAVLNLILNESCPTEFFLKNIRAFPSLLEVDKEKISALDSGFNLAFVSEQKDRLQFVQRLSLESCKQRRDRQGLKWQKWLQDYASLRKVNESSTIKNPKYVLLNFIVRNITQELENLQGSQRLDLIQKILEVLWNPYEKSQWFEEKYWKNTPVPIKLTCSS